MNKIYIFDDDKHPELRSTKVVAELVSRGVDAELVKSWTALKEGLVSGTIDKKALIVIDNSIEGGRVGERTVDFSTTLPWLTGAGGINPRQLMPGSGGMNAGQNNRVFADFMEGMHNYICTPKQMGIADTGLSGETKQVATAIMEYLVEVTPFIEGNEEPGRRS